MIPPVLFVRNNFIVKKFVFDFNEITPSKLLENNIKVKEKFCVVLVHNNKSTHKEQEQCGHCDDYGYVPYAFLPLMIAETAGVENIPFCPITSFPTVRIECELNP
jgi:hypothetical protein